MSSRGMSALSTRTLRTCAARSRMSPATRRSSRPCWAAATGSAWRAMADDDSERPDPGTRDPGSRDPGPRGDAIGLRLALMFAAVALAAIALLAGLTAAFAAAD